ncbi:Dabb family protein [Ruficoccus sp. ZRK36]|uniref:Dabb family protein n=1 Tax=Ruficoccus sp. ZRK36 TaxID=2866311 RepID=UPI001C733619|nr:Dabb family protein [Ruficoccus sp. ZRK36]QYY36073.1 Dabb family protein [Ruficoccus sp. ZRK36]
MITHVVVFWSDKPVEESRKKLLEGAKPLADIPGVQNFRFGAPVPSPRATVDDSFSMAISMDFENAEVAAAYQTHPLHQHFLKTYVGSVAKRVLVYDFEA